MKTVLASVVAALAVGGCISGEDAFVDGRLERLCGQSVPVCQVQASCVLNDRTYLRSAFPGGVRTLVVSDQEASTLEIRLYLTTMEWPGTELVVQAHSPDCVDFEEIHLLDVDLFAVAGNDRTLTWELPLRGRGDHLVEVFSDMTADYLMTVDVLEQ